MSRGLRLAVLCVAAAVLVSGCGQTWSDTAEQDLTQGVATSLAGHPYPACVVDGILKDVPAQQMAGGDAADKIARIADDCEDGVKDDNRTAVGWLWDAVYYDLLGGNAILMFLFGWEPYLCLLPVAALVAVIQLLIW